MEKMKMQTKNIVDENIDFIGKKFPNCIVEAKDDNGKITRMVDFDLLKQELSNIVVEGDKERYVMTWPDKKQAILTANAPTSKTLRPCKEKSVGKNGENGGWDSQNIYIEGDNLEVLKVLRETYLGKIKMIYIDPPYNTGNDFVYNDDFATDTEDYLERSNQVDEEGNRMVVNNESNGRFHTDWLNMIYPRLKIAKDLLTDDGVIFISIDDNEQANLKKICDEIFGLNNFCGMLIQNKGNAQNDARNIQKNHEYILVYFKSSNSIKQKILSEISTVRKEAFKDENGYYYKGAGIVTGGEGGTLNKRPNLGYSIYYNERTNEMIAVQDYNVELAKISNKEEDVYTENKELTAKGFIPIRPPKKGTKLGVWTWSIEKFNSEKKDILITKTRDSYSVCKKVYVEGDLEQEGERFFVNITKESPSRSILDYSTASGSAIVNDLLGMKVFDNPKNLDLIKYLIGLIPQKEFIVLDYFSGSSTTAHAIFEINAEQGKNIKFIMVQLPEACSDVNKNQGFETICDIGQERIRKTGQKLAEEIAKSTRVYGKNKQPLEDNEFDKSALQMAIDKLDKDDFNMKELKEFKALADKKLPDIGFRVFTLDTSNMKETYYNSNEYSQTLLDDLEENIKADRTPEDLLYQTMLELGLTLDSKIEEKEINGRKVFIVGEYNEMIKPDLICCFDANVDNETVTQIAKMQPRYAVFRDNSMAKDSVAINFDQIFETYSPTTTRRVL